MKKKEKGFICTRCGYRDKYYHVICPSCGAEDSMIEVELYEKNRGGKSSPSVFSLSDIKDEYVHRVSTKWKEFDEILGGGLVEGSIVLLAGPPGVGKSTLALSLTSNFEIPLYISGEENLSQVASRARRIGVKGHTKFAFATSLDDIKAILGHVKPDFLVIDSLQVMKASEKTSFISHNEARIFVSELVSMLKPLNITSLILGHITKEGSVAGPKTVEHLVDVVIYLGHTGKAHIRSLHVGKNRFGPSDGVMFLEMSSTGINPYADSVVLSSEKVVGRAYTVVVQGNTPKIIDVQSLVTHSYTQMPRRIISGYPSDRFSLLLAILEKKLGLKLYNKDVFVRVSGDYFWRDSGIDLGIVASVLSSYWNIPLPGNVVWIGEVDLLGNIVGRGDSSLRESVVKRVGGSLINVNVLSEVKNIIQRWR